LDRALSSRRERYFSRETHENPHYFPHRYGMKAYPFATRDVCSHRGTSRTREYPRKKGPRLPGPGLPFRAATTDGCVPDRPRLPYRWGRTTRGPEPPAVWTCLSVVGLPRDPKKRRQECRFAVCPAEAACRTLWRLSGTPVRRTGSHAMLLLLKKGSANSCTESLLVPTQSSSRAGSKARQGRGSWRGSGGTNSV
jgi:hypothetical protein